MKAEGLKYYRHAVDIRQTLYLKGLPLRDICESQFVKQ